MPVTLSMGVEVNPDLIAALNNLSALSGKSGGLERLLRESVAQMKRSINRNFAEQGRPVKWQPNSPMTIMMWLARRGGGKSLRAYAGMEKGQKWASSEAKNQAMAEMSFTDQHGKLVGVDTGDLRKTIAHAITPDMAIVYPTQPYARKFQEGGTTSMNRHQQPRPFMMVQEEDAREIERFFSNAVDRAIAGRKP